MLITKGRHLLVCPARSPQYIRSSICTYSAPQGRQKSVKFRWRPQTSCKTDRWQQWLTAAHCIFGGSELLPCKNSPSVYETGNSLSRLQEFFTGFHLSHRELSPRYISLWSILILYLLVRLCLPVFSNSKQRTWLLGENDPSFSSFSVILGRSCNGSVGRVPRLWTVQPRNPCSIPGGG